MPADDDGFDDDLAVYDADRSVIPDHLDSDALLCPLRNLSYLKRPAVVGPRATAAQALKTMNEHQIDAVLVTEGERVLGIFSIRDYLRKEPYSDGGVDEPVTRSMTPDPECLTPDDTVALALNCMSQSGYRHVPLIRGGGSTVGMPRVRDVIEFLASFFPRDVLNAPPHSECNPPDRRLEGG